MARAAWRGRLQGHRRQHALCPQPNPGECYARLRLYVGPGHGYAQYDHPRHARSQRRRARTDRRGTSLYRAAVQGADGEELMQIETLEIKNYRLFRDAKLVDIPRLIQRIRIRTGRRPGRARSVPTGRPERAGYQGAGVISGVSHFFRIQGAA